MVAPPVKFFAACVIAGIVAAYMFVVLSSPTEQSVRTMIGAEIAVGSTKEAVVGFCQSHGIYYNDKDFAQVRLVNASIPTRRLWPIEGGVFIVFHFGLDGTLEQIQVDEAYTFI